MHLTPHEAMQLAITEGHKGAGYVSPNPLVGCVILDSKGELIGQGYHERVGEGHAEVNALKSVKDAKKLEGAHVYVTLEPCAFQGRTPSCAKALAKLPIAAVTYGLEDPHPKVNGQGAEILREAGKEVTLFNGLKAELEELAEIFLMNTREKRPFVALKAATSLDGRIALNDGSSRWITGESARANVQSLRGAYDAVLVGAGTVLKDNPRLNSRDPRFDKKVQKVVVLDLEGATRNLLNGSALLEVRDPENVIVVTGSKEKFDAPVTLVHAPVTKGVFNLKTVLGELFERGLSSLFVEGGAHTFAGFLRAELADRLYLFLAPKILGDGITWTTGFKIDELPSAPILKTQRLEKFGTDLLLTGRLT